MEHLIIALVLAAVFMLLIWQMNNYEPFKLLAPRDAQTVEVPAGSGIRRLNNPICIDKLVEVPPNGARTLYENFNKGVEQSGPLPCLGHYSDREQGYVWQTYDQVAKRTTNFGSGLVKLGYKPGNSYIGVYAKNCMEWAITELSCNAYSMVLVPLYDTLGPDAVQLIVEQVELSLIVVDAANTPLLLDQLASIPQVKYVVKAGETTAAEKEAAKAAGATIMSFQYAGDEFCFLDVELLGSESPSEHVPPSPDDLATIQYTSGTTGNPKGAMLTHKAMVGDMAGAMVLITELLEISNDDTHISYLPLAHSFERLIISVMYNAGARIGFYRGDTKLILEDIKLLKPSVFISVPRLLNRVYDAVNKRLEAAGPVKRLMFKVGMYMKRRLVMRGVVTNQSLWDRIVFDKVQAALGGNLRGIISGAAPLSATVMDWLRCSMGCVVVEGYGQTENAAAATVTLPGDPMLHHVGPPLPCCEVKLIDVPEMNYFAKDGKGEVCIRGSNVFKGYFKDPEKTAEALTADGWLLTGDIGEWTSEGTLRIIDRRKNIFKLAQGEYIAPEKVENIYGTVNVVHQVYVHGSSLETMCVAVVVPEIESLRATMMGNGMNNLPDDDAELIKMKEAADTVLSAVTSAGRAAGLKGFEQAKSVFLSPVEWTVDNDLLTPSFKAKRNKLRDFYEAEIDQLYADLKKSMPE